MTQDEIIRMAREAGLEQVVAINPKDGGIITKSLPPELLERFAALVAAHEREALAEQEKQEPIGWTHAANLVDDGYGHIFSVHSSEPAYDDWVPVYAAPVSAKMQGDCTLAAVLAEREACANVCDDIGEISDGYGCAASIRERGLTKSNTGE